MFPCFLVGLVRSTIIKETKREVEREERKGGGGGGREGWERWREGGGREVGGSWEGGGREVGGRWEGGGREVGGRWVGGGWEVGGRWEGSYGIRLSRSISKSWQMMWRVS